MRIGWRGALGLLLSAAALAWALHGVPLASVWAELRKSNLLFFALSTVAATVIFPLRAARWRVILEPVAGRLPFDPLWRATAIGMMANDVAPVRAGEVARAYVAARQFPRLGFAAAIASLAVDRVLDAVVLLLLLLVAIFSPGFPLETPLFGQPVKYYAALVALGIGIVLVGLYVLVFFPARLIALYEALAGRISPRLAERGRVVLATFVAGLGLLRTPRLFGSVMLWTVAHWLMNALSFWLGFRAVGIAVPFAAALFLQTIIGISVAVPAAPGFLGVFEAAATAGLAVYGVDRTRAVSWALGYHVLSLAPIIVIGLYYFARLGLHFDDFAGRDARVRARDA